jgi:hypothetical protein
MLRTHRLATAIRSLGAAVGVVALAGLGLAAGASGCSDASSPVSGCDAVTVSGSSLNVGIRGCDAVNVNTTNIEYASHGGVSAFSFTVQCVATGKEYAGRVSNIQYQNALIVGLRLEVDGEPCN